MREFDGSRDGCLCISACPGIPSLTEFSLGRELTMTRRGPKPAKNLEQLVQDAEVRLKKLLELSDQINKLLEERERKPIEIEKTGSGYET